MTFEGESFKGTFLTTKLCPPSELMQTELHHIRTLKIMSDVYSRGMMTELLFEQQTVEKLFPCLDELIGIHSQFFQKILERKKESLVDKSEKNFLIKRMGDVLVNQVSNGKDLPHKTGCKGKLRGSAATRSHPGCTIHCQLRQVTETL